MPGQGNNKIVLGFPLDLLLNRECSYADYIKAFRDDKYYGWPDDPKNSGGIILSDNTPAAGSKKAKPDLFSGNIVIKGSPGTGKSTLAMQIAVSCTNVINNLSSIYFSLEETPKVILMKASEFRWEDQFHIIEHLHNPEDLESSEELGNALNRILTQPEKCPFRTVERGNCSPHEGGNPKAKVLVPALSPQSVLINDKNSHHELFWKRYKQLQNLLEAVKKLNEKNNENSEFPFIRLFCIDSLNVFGDQPLNRVELFRIFDLFKRYKTVGVFVIENEDTHRSYNSSQIEYLADVVISLCSEYEKGYFILYLEILKSRYHQQIYGKHPFKIFHGIKQ